MPDLSAYTNAAAGEQLAIAAAVLVALFMAGTAPIRRFRPWQSCLRARPILTANENEFFRRLHRALPGYHIFPQVSFSTLIDLPPQLSGKQQFTVRRRYGWKYADFVICHRETFDVIAIVELDDRTHIASAMPLPTPSATRRCAFSHATCPAFKSWPNYSANWHRPVKKVPVPD